jgi:hypothetical protein
MNPEAYGSIMALISLGCASALRCSSNFRPGQTSNTAGRTYLPCPAGIEPTKIHKLGKLPNRLVPVQHPATYISLAQGSEINLDKSLEIGWIVGDNWSSPLGGTPMDVCPEAIPR